MAVDGREREGLVGRDVELARIEALVDGLATDARRAGRRPRAESRAGVLALSGEPGIGKSALLAELCNRADEAGALVLEGRAAEFESEQPFAVLVDALDDYLASLNPRNLETMPAAMLAELARIFPSLDALDEAGDTTAEERYRAHRAFGALLDQLASKRPVVVTLDDLHWADDASIELLAQHLRRSPAPGVLLAVAHRNGQEPERLRAALDTAEVDGFVARLALGPLDTAGAAEILGEPHDSPRVAELHRVSGGNPFYLDRLGRASSATPASVTAPDEVGGVPAAITGAIRAETELLPDEANALLRGAAVAGERFDLDVAAEIAELSEDAALASLDELLVHDLVRATDAPRQFRFRHPIVRGAVYEGAPAGWRLSAHARAAAVLEERAAPASTQARHLECCAQPGDEAAIAVLSQAAAEAAARAPAVSAHWFAAALRLVPADDVGARIGLLVPMARALSAVGRFDEARGALGEVLALLPADQHAVRGQVVAASSKIAHVLGEHEDAHELLVGAIEELPDESSPEATALKLELGSDAFFSGDFERFGHWARVALSDSLASGDLSVQTAATGLLGCAEYLADNVAEARTRFDEADELLDRLGDDGLAQHLYSLTWWGFGEVFVERFEPAIVRLDRGIAVARRTGQGFARTPMRITQAFALLWLGRLAEADERLDAAIEVSTLSGNPQALSWALWVRSWSATLAGDVRKAIQLGERAIEVSGGTADPISAIAGCNLAEAQLEAGDPTACREGILASVGGSNLPEIERGFRSRWYEILTRADLALGDHEAAERWAAEAERAADGLEIHGRSCEALRARAAVLLAGGSATEAGDVALSAVGEAEASALPIEAARSRILAGRALAGADLPDRASAELNSAHKALVAVGAIRYADEAALELRGLGKRVTRSRRKAAAANGDGLDALSKREREVAELIADGRANKEIAAELFLSERTIETHVTRAFAKLGLSKRAQLAALVAQKRK